MINKFEILVAHWKAESLTVTENLQQIFNLTYRIDKLSNHLIESKQKDKSSKRGLIILVSRRNKLMKYERRQSEPNYNTIQKMLRDKKAQKIQ